MFTITEAVQKWRQYLLGRRFIIITDQQPLKSLTNQVIQTPEQQHWLSKLIDMILTFIIIQESLIQLLMLYLGSLYFML